VSAEMEGWLPEHWSTGATRCFPPNFRLDGRAGPCHPCSTGSSYLIGCRTGHGKLAGSGGARWRWVSLDLRDQSMLSRKLSYRNPVTLMGYTLGHIPSIPCPFVGTPWRVGSRVTEFVTALIECGVCVPSNYTGFYIKCNLLRNKEK